MTTINLSAFFDSFVQDLKKYLHRNDKKGIFLYGQLVGFLTEELHRQCGEPVSRSLVESMFNDALFFDGVLCIKLDHLVALASNDSLDCLYIVSIDVYTEKLRFTNATAVNS